MEKIPTAEEMVDLWQKEVLENMGTEKANQRSLEDTIIRFAKLHVEAALKEAAKHLPYDDKMNQSLLDERAILKSYPLENIK